MRDWPGSAGEAISDSDHHLAMFEQSLLINQ
jgi:hypothetical protein